MEGVVDGVMNRSAKKKKRTTLLCQQQTKPPFDLSAVGRTKKMEKRDFAVCFATNFFDGSKVLSPHKNIVFMHGTLDPPSRRKLVILYFIYCESH